MARRGTQAKVQSISEKTDDGLPSIAIDGLKRKTFYGKTRKEVQNS